MKVEHKIIAAFTLGFVSVVLLGYATYFNARNLLSRNELVVHTFRVISTIDDVLGGSVQIQSGARGYLLTGRQEYLQPYAAGITSVQDGLTALRKLTADNPVQQQGIDALQSAINRMLANTQEEVRRREKEGAVAIPSFGVEDKENMDQVRFHAAGIKANENRLLQERDGRARESARQTMTNLIVLMGVAVCLVAVFYAFIRHDLAARRRADQALRESDQKVRALMDSAPDALLIADEQGNIQMANAEAERLFGYPREAFQDRRLPDLLVARDDSDEDESGTPVRLAKDQALVGFRTLATRFDGVRRDGTAFPIALSSSTVQLGKEKVVINAVRDRTDQERAEESIRKFSLDLARSNAELERFAYVASHDLQEPLRMVSSYTQLLSRRYKGKLDANADEFIGYAVDGANRMQKLINDLLALSRVGTQAKPSEPVDTGVVLGKVLSDLKLSLEAAGASVNVPAALPTVMGDATQIGQLFQNLIGNAVKFRGSEPPRVDVSVEREENDDFWRFAFKDNGIGIEPQYFERIFIIFQRLHSKESYPGTGIGLAICKKIVERLGGSLWVESTPSQGATFFFTLPVVP